jgi:hypothetical protein
VSHADDLPGGVKRGLAAFKQRLQGSWRHLMGEDPEPRDRRRRREVNNVRPDDRAKVLSAVYLEGSELHESPATLKQM